MSGTPLYFVLGLTLSLVCTAFTILLVVFVGVTRTPAFAACFLYDFSSQFRIRRRAVELERACNGAYISGNKKEDTWWSTEQSLFLLAARSILCGFSSFKRTRYVLGVVLFGTEPFT